MGSGKSAPSGGNERLAYLRRCATPDGREPYAGRDPRAIFLIGAEAFAPNLAVYVAKADGLALWKTRGSRLFPKVVSKETIDPEAYFRPIVVRERPLPQCVPGSP